MAETANMPMSDIAASVIPRIRPRIIVILVATVLLVTAVAYIGALRYFERQAGIEAENQLALYLRSLNEALKQHQHLPYILSQNAEIAAAVQGGTAESLNEVLRDYADAANLEAIYIMDLAGTVTAASNAGTERSFLGQNYRFRPYFQEALAGSRSNYFAIGATTGRPGYFVAEPVKDPGGTVIGVVVIKLDFSEFQEAWQDRQERVLAVNSDGITVLAANKDWLYRDLFGLSEADRASISQSRQFGNEPLRRLSWSMDSPDRLLADGERFIVASALANWQPWTVYYLIPEADLRRQTVLSTGLAGTVVALLIGFATFLRSQRIAVALEASQRHRRELIVTNQRLVAAQEELARTSKLAALGQLAASVSHELGQPISALKNHIAAAEIGNEITSPETAGNLRKLAERMEAISGELRFFARSRGTEISTFDLRDALQEALSLLSHDLTDIGVMVSEHPAKACVSARRIEIEQAIVNIVRNAVQAVSERTDAAIEIALAENGVNWVLSVADNGHGLGASTVETLQEPFFSTKPSGVGMGLGLAIVSEILRGHDGFLTAENRVEGGAVFSLVLPKHRAQPHE